METFRRPGFAPRFIYRVLPFTVPDEPRKVTIRMFRHIARIHRTPQRSSCFGFAPSSRADRSRLKARFRPLAFFSYAVISAALVAKAGGHPLQHVGIWILA